jgi:hypothetical protein
MRKRPATLVFGLLAVGCALVASADGLTRYEEMSVMQEPNGGPVTATCHMEVGKLPANEICRLEMRVFYDDHSASPATQNIANAEVYLGDGTRSYKEEVPGTYSLTAKFAKGGIAATLTGSWYGETAWQDSMYCDMAVWDSADNPLQAMWARNEINTN